MEKNPAVNRYLRDKAMDRIDHALGRPVWPLRETYRNHYAADAGGALAIELAISPHWESHGTQGTMAYFGVNDAGRKALGAYLETLEISVRHRAYVVTYEGYEVIVPARSRAHARYVNWLRISDCLSELTFGEFLRGARVRVAA